MCVCLSLLKPHSLQMKYGGNIQQSEQYSRSGNEEKIRKGNCHYALYPLLVPESH